MPMQKVVAPNFMDFTGNLFNVTILWEGGHIQQICCFSAIHHIVAASLVLLQYMFSIKTCTKTLHLLFLLNFES